MSGLHNSPANIKYNLYQREQNSFVLHCKFISSHIAHSLAFSHIEISLIIIIIIIIIIVWIFSVA